MENEPTTPGGHEPVDQALVANLREAAALAANAIGGKLAELIKLAKASSDLSHNEILACLYVALQALAKTVKPAEYRAEMREAATQLAERLTSGIAENMVKQVETEIQRFAKEQRGKRRGR